MATRQEPWRRTAGAILRRVRTERDVAVRMAHIAQGFAGAPYLANPLIGGPDQLERLVIRLDAFDCVTFVEQVLALARSASAAGFRDELIRTRYRAGVVDWAARLHYFSDWLAANQRRGAIRIRTPGPGARTIQARLSSLAGLPARRVRFALVPKRYLARARSRLVDGSIVAFATLRRDLDFFHTGLVFYDRSPGLDAGPMLWHASRSAGRVIAQPLFDYLARNRMRGIALAVAGQQKEPE